MSSRSQVLNNNTTSFPNNNSGQITPQVLRDFNSDFINSVRFSDEPITSATSASFATTAGSASFATTAKFLDGTVTSASYAVNAGYADDADKVDGYHASAFALNVPFLNVSQSFVNTSASFSERITNQEIFSSSLDATFATDAQVNAATGSLIATASVANNVITFTKGNNTTFSITVDTGSATINTGSFAKINVNNTFTGTQNFNNITVAGTASISNLVTVTGSAVIIGDRYIVLNANPPVARYAGLQVYDSGSTTTASFEWDGNNDNWIIVEETGLSAGILTGPTGSKGNEVFPTYNTILKGSGHHTVGNSNITDNGSLVTINSNTAITASSFKVHLIPPVDSDSLIVDTNGVTAPNGFSANSLTYPTTDGLAGQVIETDGAGTLSFGDIETIFETVYTGESVTKGDPLYISGSQGANPKVYRADASNAAKMPVTFIASETIGASNTTRGIVLGLIEGINLTGYNAGQEVYVASGGGWTSTRPTGSSIVQLLGIVTKGGSGGKGLVLNPGPVLLPNLASGYTWVGNNNSVPTATTTSSLLVSTASFATQATSASYASFAMTASNSTLFNNLSSSQFAQVRSTNTFTTTNTFSGTTNFSTTANFNALNPLQGANGILQFGFFAVDTLYFVSSSVKEFGVSNDLTKIGATGAAAKSAGIYVSSGSVVGTYKTAIEFTNGNTFDNSIKLKFPTQITGSLRGQVTDLTIASSTASMDLSLNNFFTLQLVSGSNTYINPTNILPGQTINLLLSTTGSATVSFPSSVKQISGSSYVPTTTTSKDIVTFISFDNSSLYLVMLKT